MPDRIYRHGCVTAAIKKVDPDIRINLSRHGVQCLVYQLNEMLEAAQEAGLIEDDIGDVLDLIKVLSEVEDYVS